MTPVTFNTESDATVKELSVVVEIGYEYTIDTSDAGRTLVYTLADGVKVPRKYDIPVSMSTRKLLSQVKSIEKDVYIGLANGELASLIDIIDALVGGGIVEAVGTDESVSTDDFLKFLNWIVDKFKLPEVFGSPGN